MFKELIEDKEKWLIRLKGKKFSLIDENIINDVEPFELNKSL
jgi:hypothetical protein